MRRRRMQGIGMFQKLCAVVLLILCGTSTSAASAQDSETTRCATYPAFCVPHAGRVPAMTIGHDRVGADEGEPYLVRGMTAQGLFFLGDPAAPIHFLVFHSFTCSHCSGYYQIELTRFIDDYVASGQAALQVGMLSFTMQPYSDNAVHAALCAGEQGAFWEMQHELFMRGSREGVTNAYTPAAIEEMARDLGLDPGRVAACVADGRYGFLMDRFALSAMDLGVSATPTVLMRRGDGGWEKVTRNYDNLAQLAEDAHTATGPAAGSSGH